MIASLHGPVLDIKVDALVIAVGGIGMLVQCAPDTIAGAQLNSPITLHTSLVVREDSLTLFGFADSASRELFELLQGVSGVGPKLAFGILATLSPRALVEAISGEDIPALTRVPGVGQKGAARLVLELKDRVGPSGSDYGAAASRGWQAQVHAGLTGLGWSTKEVDKVVAQLSTDAKAPADNIAELMKLALSLLGRSS